ncbi:MAG: hypothetical protein IKM15_03920 [Peptococcaceae bacterium]|nr:hypothetical protein [Peptococcaceae bacterium]
MKKYLSILLVGWAFLLGGCSFNMATPESLITAPLSTQEQVQQRQMITSFLDNEEVLITPANQQLSRAYLFEDLDNDGKDEIVAFYRSKESKFVLGFMILRQAAGEWNLQHKVVAYGTDIDYFEVTDLDSQPGNELLFGVKTGYGSSKELNVYQMYNEQIIEVTKDKPLDYEQILLAEMSKEKPLLIAATMDISSLVGSSTIELYTMQEDTLQITDQKVFSGYCNALRYGRVSEKEYGLMAAMRHNHFTNILILTNEENKLQLKTEYPLMYDEADMQKINIFEDTNADGVLEVCSMWTPEENNTAKNYQDYLRVWLQWDGDKELQKVNAVLENSTEGYRFVLDVDWLEQLYYRFNLIDNIIWTEFYLFDDDGKQQEVFAIAAVDQLSWEKEVEQDQVIILGNSPSKNKIYLAKINSQQAEILNIDQSKLISCLKIDGGKS